MGTNVALPIPWNTIAQYADRLRLPPLSAEAFIEVIVTLDRRHREWHRSEEDRKAAKDRRRAERDARRKAKATGRRGG